MDLLKSKWKSHEMKLGEYNPPINQRLMAWTATKAAQDMFYILGKPYICTNRPNKVQNRGRFLYLFNS